MENVNTSDFLKQRWQNRGLGFTNPWLNAAGISNHFPSPLPIACEKSLTKLCPNIVLRVSQHMKTLHLSCEVNRLNILQAEVIAFGFLTTLPFRLGHISNSFSPWVHPEWWSPAISPLPPDILKLQGVGRSLSPWTHFQPCFRAQKALSLY